MASSRKRKSVQPDLLESESKSGPPIKKKPTPLPIEQLPLNLFVKVINYLPIAQWPHLERVNRKFRDVMHETWLSLKRIRLAEDFVSCRRYRRPENPDWIESILEKLLLRAPNLIDIGGFDQSCQDTRGQLKILAQFKKLQRVEIGRSIDFYVEKFLLESQSRGVLKELILGKRDQIFMNASTQRPLKNLKNQPDLIPLQLNTIDFSGGYWFYPHSISNVIDASRLRSISILVGDKNLLTMINRTPNLERLNIIFGKPCPFEKVKNDISSEPNQFLVSVANLKHLESLSMKCACSDHSGCYDGIAYLAEQIDRRGILKEISLSGGFAIPRMMTCSSKLTSLELDPQKCDDETVERALASQRSMIKVRLFTNFQHEISIPVLPHLNQCVTTLRSLRLEYTIRSMSMDDLYRIGTFTGLEELSIFTLAFVTFTMDDSILDAWGQGFGSRLKILEIVSRHSTVTDAGLVAFLSKTPRLNHLRMVTSTCHELSISDEALKEIPKYCPNLSTLKLGACGPKITTAGLQVVIDKCSILKFVFIHSTYADRYFLKRLKMGKYRKITILVKP